MPFHRLHAINLSFHALSFLSCHKLIFAYLFIFFMPNIPMNLIFLYPFLSSFDAFTLTYLFVVLFHAFPLTYHSLSFIFFMLFHLLIFHYLSSYSCFSINLSFIIFHLLHAFPLTYFFMP